MHLLNRYKHSSSEEKKVFEYKFDAAKASEGLAQSIRNHLSSPRYAASRSSKSVGRPRKNKKSGK